MFNQLTSFENLLLAFQNAARGKRGRPSVARFEHQLENHLIELRQSLRTRTYLPGGYRSFFIHEPKRRLISAAPFRDRVVHHALCNVTDPLFERGFIFDSYANRVGKGTHRALERCQGFSRQNPFVLQMDIRQFFPSVDHQILLRRLRSKITDPRVLGLIAKILDSGREALREEYDLAYFPGDDLFAALRPRGLPIGNLTSQFWANVYLDPLDHFIKRELRCKAYVRYVDDLVLFGESKKILWSWKAAIEGFLQNLRLRAHKGSHPKPVSEGIPFLGFVTYPRHRRLKRRKGIHYRRKLRALVRNSRLAGHSEDQLRQSFQGWANHCQWANTVGLRKALAKDAGAPWSKT